MRGTQHVQVKEGETLLLSFDEEFALDVDARGAFAVHTMNSAGYGRDAVFDGHLLWLRPHTGKYHRRAPVSDDEPDGLVDDTFAAFGAAMDLIGGSAKVDDRGVATFATRPARTVGLSRDEAGKREPSKTWRDTISVQTLVGEATLDQATGTLLYGTLHTTLTFLRDGRAFAMHLSVAHTVSDIGAEVAITPPSGEESQDTPTRSKEREDLAELLHGIAAPAKGATLRSR